MASFALNSKNIIALAPMAGVSDFAFREICKSQGADLLYTEMVSSRALCYHDKKTAQLLKFTESQAPIGAQIFGSDPDVMAEGARTILSLGKFDFIDINMGCPTPKIVKNGDGAALMKNPKLAGEIVGKIKAAVSVPVTVKFRKGWDSGSENAVEFANILEAAGADMLTVHGRTAVQMYSGRSDLDSIKKVKAAVHIPVLANGDIVSVDAYKKAISYTGADGAMIGRAAFGNPFIFAELKAYVEGKAAPTPPKLSEKMNLFLKQTQLHIEDKGEHIAMLEARKHMAWYLTGVPNSHYYKNRIFNITTQKELIFLVNEIIHNLEEGGNA